MALREKLNSLAAEAASRANTLAAGGRQQGQHRHRNREAEPEDQQRRKRRSTSLP